MNDEIECRLTLKRIYKVPISRVWRAWTDPKELGRWYVAGDDHIVHFCEADVRVGGTYRVGFGPPGTTPYVESGRYLEIVRERRLVFEETVSRDGEGDLHVHKTEIEFRDIGGATEIELTTTGPNAWRSGGGWIPCLVSLARHLGLRT